MMLNNGRAESQINPETVWAQSTACPNKIESSGTLAGIFFR